jgi:hypothetical protein
MSESDYKIAINEEPGPSQKVYAPAYTNTYFLSPSSGAWHIYGEYDTERGKIVSTVGLPPDELFPHDFLSE